MKKLLYIIGGGKPLKRSSLASCTLNSLPLLIAIITTAALAISACEKVDFGDDKDLDRTRLATENDSTQTNDTTTATLEIYIQGAQWEDNDTINF